MSGFTACGTPIVVVDTGVYAVTFPGPISAQFVEVLKREWGNVMPNSRLIVLDAGAQITRLDEPELTPIYDALMAERRAS